jgi:hypothetical protein
MKNIVKTTAVLFGITFAVACMQPVSAEGITLTKHTNDPVTNLPPDQWLAMISQYLQPEAIVGKPEVVAINATSEFLTVTCDKWTIVGPKVEKHVTGNPRELKPFSITLINTESFDGYCTMGVIGHPTIGASITGELNDSAGNFTNATVVTFIRH